MPGPSQAVEASRKGMPKGRQSHQLSISARWQLQWSFLRAVLPTKSKCALNPRLDNANSCTAVFLQGLPTSSSSVTTISHDKTNHFAVQILE